MKTRHVATLFVLVTTVFVSGLAAGIWFSQHYRIVAVGAPAGRTAEVQPPPMSQFPRAAAIMPAIENSAAPAASAPKGPLSYHFVPGETMHYGIEAGIQGTGLDLGLGANIAMNLASSLSLYTERVEPDGTGSLRLSFDNLDMTGDFMGSPIELHQSPERTLLNMNAQTKIDSSQGRSLGLIPQLDFFKQPVAMTVSPNGTIQKLEGAWGMEQLLAAVTRLSPDNGESAVLQPNAHWTSEFLMPIPGLGEGVKTVTNNTVTGYQVVEGHPCAVVQQEMRSSQSGGTLAMQSGGSDGGLSFGVPLFSVLGNNVIYFDTVNGKLVRCDLNLEFNLQLSQQLKPLGDFVNLLGEVLGDGSAGGSGKAGGASAPGNAADIGVKIAGTMKLNE